jgi:glycosyltransferase involved in cell wall biosynthesis
MVRPLRAVFVVPYPPGLAGGQRYRFEQWLRLIPEGRVESSIVPLWRERDYAMLWAPGRTGAKMAATCFAALRRLSQLRAAKRADVVWLYREAFPLGPPVADLLVERGAPTVLDFDDAIWIRTSSAANRWVERLKQPSKVATVASQAAIVTVGNAYLASWAQRFAQRVVILPTTLDVERCQPSYEHLGVNRPVVVGWVGSPTTGSHLQLIDTVLERLSGDPRIELRLIGAPRLVLNRAPSVVVRPWQAASEEADIGSLDIGLMPLPDDEWARGKCGFKALHYMAHGVPPVVSPVGVNAEIVEHGVNGLHATSDEEWLEGIALLAKDPGLRSELGRAARETVVERFSGQRWAGRFVEVLEEAASLR